VITALLWKAGAGGSVSSKAGMGTGIQVSPSSAAPSSDSGFWWKS